MNKLSTVFIMLLIFAVGMYVLYNYSKDKNQDLEEAPSTSESAEYETFTDARVGLMFQYKVSPEEYVVDDLSEFIGTEPQGARVVKVYRVMNAQEKFELENSEGGREGPPTINILVFENVHKQSPSIWVDATPQFSNIDFVIGNVDRDSVIGGANAVRYRSDGLYLSDNVVVAHGPYIYHFIGSFLEEGSTIQRDFAHLIDTVNFVPTESMPAAVPPAKIDPHVACESALAYMTFASGEEADAFVSACVNGEHPEVIDRYREDMGLDGTMI